MFSRLARQPNIKKELGKNTMLLFFLVSTAVCAGVGLHAAITTRIHAFLPHDMQQLHLQPLLLAGAFFPDSFYTCGDEQASEAIHWPPFLSEAVRYHRDKFRSSPHSQQALQLKAFLYGVFTHQVMDSSWHSIRMDEGLLQYLSYADFDGDYSEAHQFADTAGDFLLLRRYSDKRFFSQDWHYPNWNDIHDILARLGVKMSAPMAKYCAMRGETALKTEVRAVDSVPLNNFMFRPLLDEVLDTYYLGGLQEITDTIITCLPYLDDWFENGPSTDPWDLCPAIPRPKVMSSPQWQVQSHYNEQGIVISTYTALSNFGHALALGDFLNEPSLAISALTEDQVGSVYVLPLSDYITMTSTDTRRAFRLQPPSFSSTIGGTLIKHDQFQSQHRFGTSMCAYKVFDITYLLVTEPGTSSVHIFHESSLVLTVRDFEASPAFGGTGKHQEGFQVKTFAINNDAIPDIILTAPMNDYNGTKASGAVIVIDGALLLQVMLQSDTLGQVVDLRMLIHKRIYLPQEYNVGGYEQFGSSLSIVKKWMFVGARGLGALFQLSLDDYSVKHVIQMHSIDDGPVKRMPSSESGLFGGNCIKSGIYHGITFLMVSAHRENFQGCISCGAVYLYRLDQTTGVPRFWTRLVLNAKSENSNSKFGKQVTIHGEVVLLTAEGYAGNGALFSVGLATVFHSENECIVKDIVMQSDSGYTGFGSSMLMFDDQVVISEPLYGYDELLQDSKKLMGRVGIYNV